MPELKETKDKVIKENAVHEGDTGSPEVQISLLTNRITSLMAHFDTHKKDHHSRRGLIHMVGRRRKLLDYLKANAFNRYQDIIQKQGIRK